jgi:hypothetical protein
MAQVWGGKYGSVSVGAVNPVLFPFGEWTVAMDGDDPDTTNFISGGCAENIDGIHEGTITLRGPWKVGAMPLVRGNLYTFNLGVGGGVTIPVPARVKTITPSQKVRGKSEVEVTAKTCGVFTPAIT